MATTPFDETPIDRPLGDVETSPVQADPTLPYPTEALGQTAVRRGNAQAAGLAAEYAGTVAEASGRSATAQNLYKYADRKLGEAQQIQAGAQRLADIQSAGDLGEFVVNAAGESLPVSSAALGGTAVAGPLAGAALTLPINAGETASNMRHDPNSTATPQERLAASTGAGVIQSALDVLPEARVFGRLGAEAAPAAARTVGGALGRGAAEVGKTTGLEALTEGLQDTTSRAAQNLYNPEVGVNPFTDAGARESFLENAAAGAAGAGPMAVVSGGATAAGALPTGRAAPGTETAAPGAERIPASETAGEQTGPVRDLISQLRDRLARAPDQLDPNRPVMEQAEQVLANDEARTDSLSRLRDSLLRRQDLTDAERQELQDTELDLDPDAQERVGQLGDQFEARDAALRETQRLQPAGATQSRRAPTAGFEQVDKILGGDEASHPVVRQYLDTLSQKAETGTLDTADIDGALDVFGERGYSVLRALKPSEANAQVIEQDQRRRGDFDQFLLQSLRPEYRNTMRPRDLRQLSSALQVELTNGTAELRPFLERAFTNPDQVLEGLDASLRGERAQTRGAATPAAQESDDAQAEFGDTQTVEQPTYQWFGDTTGNRRIRTGGLGIPAPIDTADADVLRRATDAAARTGREVEQVDAASALREMGVDPAEVAAELGRDSLQGSVLLRVRDQEGDGAGAPGRAVRTLRSSSVERLNRESGNPSAGSYVAATDAQGRDVAIDLRRLVGDRVFGRRDQQSIRDALSEGLGQLTDQGYTYQLPDSAVVARYKDGDKEVAVTVGDLGQSVNTPRQGPRESETGNDVVGLDPETAQALDGVVPVSQNPEGTMHFARLSDVNDVLQRYALQTLAGSLQRRGGSAVVPEAVASFLRTASPASVALDGTTASLTGQQPENLDLGSLRSPGSPIDQLARAAAERDGLSPALRLLAQGAAQSDNPAVRDFWQRQLDRRPAPADNTLTDTQAQRRDLEDFAAQQGMMELDPDRLQAQTIEAAGGKPARGETPAIGRKRPGPSPLDFGRHIDRVTQRVQQRNWSTGNANVNVPGAWAAPMATAQNGFPLRVGFALNRGEALRSQQAQSLMDAYRRRGFTIHDGQLQVDMDTGPYSKSAFAKVLGPSGTDPVDVLITAGASTPAVMLARRMGVPVLDITVPTQAKIAGDLARAFDKKMREDLHNRRESMAPAANREARKDVDTREGVQRSRDLLAANIDKQLSAQWADPAATERLLRLGRLAYVADDDFFDAGLARKSANDLADRIDELEQTHNEYLKQTGKASERAQGTTNATPEQVKNLTDYLDKVLPDNITLHIGKLPGVSGLFEERMIEDADGKKILKRIVHVAINAGNPMSTAFHESMHALISVLRGQKDQGQFIKVLDRAASDPRVLTKMRTLLQDEPAAQAQLHDAEERIAYMYELWASGLLELNSQPTSMLEKFTGWLRATLSILSNEQKAEMFLQAFKDGKLRRPSAVGRLVQKSMTGAERTLYSSRVADRVITTMDKFLRTSHGRLKNYGNPALSAIADRFYARSDTQGQRAGYLQTVREVTNMFGTQLANIIRTMDQQQISDLSAALHSEQRPTDPALAEKYDETKRLLRRIYQYLKLSKVDVAEVKDYFPQAWSREYIDDNYDAFVDMLVANGQTQDQNGQWVDMTPESAAAAADTLLGENGKLELSEDLAGFSPYMEASNERKIRLKDRAKAAAFMDPDIVRVLTRYVTQAAKRGEYTKHFGQGGEWIKDQLARAKKYGLTDEQVKNDVAPAIRAMEGTLGSNIDPGLRSAMSGLITWQNLVVLPLSIFSSLIDPMGIVVRGGEVSDAWAAFKAGVKNIPGSLRQNGAKLDIQRFAEDVGTVEESFVLDLLGDMYGSNYMSDWARKTNNLLFKYNLMEGWNTAMRSAATVAAEKFILRHAAGEGRHSERWLSELGLKASDVRTGADGRLLYRAQDFIDQGMDPKAAIEHSRLIREALVRWVDGAVLRPHAGDRPAWASDPHWMLVWHLKQFTYSFQRTILDRATHELKNGNYAPMLTLAAYVPFMIAADFLKAMLQGGGDEPDWYKKQDAGDLVWNGVQRAGLLGVRQFATDGIESPAFTLGPTFSYAMRAGEKAMDGDVTGAALSGLPGHALWRDWVK